MYKGMHKKQRRSITRKITELLLKMVLTVLFLVCVFSILSLLAMKNISEESNRKLGQTAACNTENALEDIAGEQLLTMAVERAANMENRFQTVAANVRGIAGAAESIYANPETYPDREVALPVKGSNQLAAQLLWSKKLDSPTEENWRELHKLANIQELLLQYNANNNMISSAYLATVSGWFIQADYIPDAKYGKNGSKPDYFEAEKRQWYKQALLARRGEIVYSDIMEDIHSGGTCIVCACPVYQDGKIVAVAGIGSYLDTIRKAVLDTEIGEKGYAFLVNASGQVIISPKEDGETAGNGKSGNLENSGNRQLAQAVREAGAGKSGVMEAKIDARDVYLAYAPLKSLGWSFIAVMDADEVLSPAVNGQKRILALSDEAKGQQERAIRNTILIFFVAMLLAAGLISMIGITFASRLTAPLRRLTKDVKRMEGGNLDCRTNIKSGDEIEDLGNAFNDMTEQLQDYIENMREVTAEKERIQTELSVAAGIQADMLPKAEKFIPYADSFKIYAKMCPAKAVGGDFYDFFLTDEKHLAFLVADVSGKGVPAALFMVVAKTLIANRCMMGEEPSEVFTAVNKTLCRENQNGMFLTAWLGILELTTGKLTYTNAGHNSPLIYRWDETTKKLEYRYVKERTGFVLAGMEDSVYCQKQIQLERGDKLFLYSDGVTEANNEQQELYGDDRLIQYLNAHKTLEPQELCSGIWRQLEMFQGSAPQFDDITVLSIKYAGKGKKHGREYVTYADINRQPQMMEFVEKKLKEEGVKEEETARILTAVDEVYTNICRYSGAKEVTVKCSVENGRVTICFLDDGTAFNPLKAESPDLQAPLEKRSPGGLGIHLVKKLMDSVSYKRKNGKNELTMRKAVKKEKEK